MKVLMPHQKRALEYAMPRARIALYLEMRLGKTLVAIRWVKYNKNSISNVLVLAPKSVLPTWASQLKEEKQNFQIPTGTLEERFEQVNNGKSGWTLLNYEAVTLFPDFLSFDWDCLILDESTAIRNPSSQITKLLLSHTDRIKYKAILSGLPAPESPMDYFCQMRFLYDSFMHQQTYWHWRNKYCTQVGYSWEVKKSWIPVIKEEIHKLAFILTRKEAGIGSKKIYEERFVESNAVQRALTKDVDKKLKYTHENKEEFTKYATTKYLWLARIAGGFTPKEEITLISDKKLKELVYLLENDLKGEQIIIWFRFNNELNYVRNELIKRLKLNVGIFTADEKCGINEDMTLKKELDVMCAQERSGKMGLPWHDSSAMIFYSNWYDYEVRAQCEDRGVHPMKKEPYLIIDLITQDSIDEKAVELLKKKKLVAKYFMKKLDEEWNKK